MWHDVRIQISHPNQYSGGPKLAGRTYFGCQFQSGGTYLTGDQISRDRLRCLHCCIGIMALGVSKRSLELFLVLLVVIVVVCVLSILRYSRFSIQTRAGSSDQGREDVVTFKSGGRRAITILEPNIQKNCQKIFKGDKQEAKRVLEESAKWINPVQDTDLL